MTELDWNGIQANIQVINYDNSKSKEEHS